ncbi:MAG: HK97 family phage prohead protease [Pseudomonadota bacterium]
MAVGPVAPLTLTAAVPGVVRGYASRFGEADRGGDVVAPGAFARSLARLRAGGRRVAFLWQHDAGRPIGVWDRIVEDGAGLVVEGRLLAGVQAGREAAALLAAGAVDGLSIGYRARRAEPRQGAGTGRRLIEIDLWDVSRVTFPMLQSARASLAGPDAQRGAAGTGMAGRLAGALAERKAGRDRTRRAPRRAHPETV